MKYIAKQPNRAPLSACNRFGACALVVLFAFLALAQTAGAQDDKRIEDPDIIIEVDGVACPFCAYGVEKRLRKIDSVVELSVLLEEGKVEMKLNEGATVSEERIRKAVAEAGFDARSIVFVNEEARAASGSGR